MYYRIETTIEYYSKDKLFPCLCYLNINFVKDKDLTYICYDLGLLNHHNDIWTLSNNNNTKLDRLSEYSKLSKITSGDEAWIYVTIDHSVCLEFDVQLITTDFTKPYCQFGQSPNAMTRINISFPTAIQNGNWHSIKIKLQNGIALISSESTSSEKYNLNNYDATLAMYFRFRLNQLPELNFKNFIVYSLE